MITVRITWSPRGDAARSGLPWLPWSWIAYTDEFCTELLATGRDRYEYADVCADIAMAFGDRARIIEPTSVPVVAR